MQVFSSLLTIEKLAILMVIELVPATTAALQVNVVQARTMSLCLPIVQIPKRLRICAATVVACYGLAFSGGFSGALLAMDWNSYLQAEGGPIEYPDRDVPESAYTRNPAVVPENVWQPELGKLIAFMAVIYLIGIPLPPSRECTHVFFRITFPRFS